MAGRLRHDTEKNGDNIPLGAAGKSERVVLALNNEMDKGEDSFETVGTPSSIEVQLSGKSDEVPVCGAGAILVRSESGLAIPSSESSCTL